MAEQPSEDVLRLVHAFGDAGRKDAVRDLAARVRANEAELDALGLAVAAAVAYRDGRATFREMCQALDAWSATRTSGGGSDG